MLTKLFVSIMSITWFSSPIGWFNGTHKCTGDHVLLKVKTRQRLEFQPRRPLSK